MKNYVDFFVPFPVLTTERLKLRLIKRKDLKDLYECCKKEEVARYCEWEPHRNIGVTRQYISWVLSKYRNWNCTTFVIEEEKSGRAIGTCSFVKMDPYFMTAEIGYCISLEFWGKGYAKEAVGAVLRFGFEEIGLKRIEARIMTANNRSVELIERLGFKREGILRKGIYCKGDTHDLYIYSMTDDDYMNEADILE